VASEEEKLSGQESANGSGAGSQRLTGRRQIETIDVKPGWPADDIQPGRQVKTCTKCQYPRLLLDFRETEISVDKRQDVCRACMATISAMSNCKELYHLALTPAEAWSRAKTCIKCGNIKEIRDFAHNARKSDRTERFCRSCRSMYDKARVANMPVDTPQRCDRCDELKPARAFHVSPKAACGLFSTCKACQMVLQIERRARLKKLPMQIPEKQSKICTTCGKLKKASDFHKQYLTHDNRCYVCKLCRSARAKEARKERGAVEAPPSTESI
jgi:hypothetical protein